VDGQSFNRFFGGIRLGHHRHGEAQLGGLFQALLAARGRAHFVLESAIKNRFQSLQNKR
jgi:hypothetical protein